MAKYFGLLLLLITFFVVGCSQGPQEATEEEATQDMDLESYDTGMDPEDDAAAS